MLYEFAYLAPRDEAELVGVLDEHKDDGMILAGGTDLLPNVRNGIRKPRCVIDLKRVPGTDRLGPSASGGLSIGPAVTINDVMRDKLARERWPVLCESAHELASHQVRNRATVCGNVVNASPCADMAPALLSLGATASLRSKSGSRVVPFREFFTGVKRTVLAPGEYLERIDLPASSAGASGRYLKLKRIAGHDLGIVGVLLVRLGGKLLFGVSSAAPTPVLVDSVLPGDPPEEAVRKVLAAVSPIDDVRSTREYREYMIGVYVRRLLAEVK